MLLRMLLQTLSTGSSFAASCERLLQESAFAGEEGAVEEDRTRLRCRVAECGRLRWS